MFKPLSRKPQLRNASTVAAALLCSAAAFAPLATHAQSAADWPNKPLRIVVPVPPGGAADVLSRLFSEKMTAVWKQPVVVENRPGAGTIVGADAVAKSEDGHTILVTVDSTINLNGALYSKLPYDPATSFAPVSLAAYVPGLIAANPNAPFKTLPEMLAYAKANPGKLDFGSGVTAMQLAGETMNKQAGVKMQHVQYRAGGILISAAISGEVPVVFDGISTALPMAKAGKVRALAVTSAQRVSFAPDIPTVAELGLKGYEVVPYVIVLMPARTPQAIIDKVNKEIVRIEALPEVREKLINLGVEPATSTPQELGAMLKRDTARWTPVIKELGIRAD